MTTTLDLIEATRSHLFTGQTEILNRLASPVDANDESFTLEYDIAAIGPGTVLEIDLELIYVFARNNGAKQVTDCIRGYNGTTATTHDADAPVTVKPKFPNSRILQALNDDLKDLSSPVNGLAQIKTVDLTYNAAVMGYDLTAVTDILQVAEIRYRTPGPDSSWPLIRNYALMRNMATSDFASGSALVVYEGGYPGQAIRVRYKAPFGSLVALDDDVEDETGLPGTAHDLPPLGAAVRLVAGREVKRNFIEAQGEPRRADEVPPTANLQSSRELLRIRQQRIVAEQARMLHQYGYGLVS